MIDSNIKLFEDAYWTTTTHTSERDKKYLFERNSWGDYASTRCQGAWEGFQLALATNEQEPVAYMAVDKINGDYILEREKDDAIEWTPLYTHPSNDDKDKTIAKLQAKIKELVYEHCPESVIEDYLIYCHELRGK